MQMKRDINTNCVHGESKHTEDAGVLTPIYTSTAYNYLDADPLNYPRYSNTTNQKEVSDKIKLLESGEFGMVFSSGMAAISTAVLAVVSKGDHVVFQGDIYGGTYFAMATELEKFGIEFSFTEGVRSVDFEKCLRPNTKLVYLETPSNPLLKIVDVKAIVSLCQSNGLLSMIDNTFASPVNQQPVRLGVDIVVHSGTKYLGGHSDITCGAVVTSSEIGESLYRTAVNLGGSLDPQTCYLLDRSLKTLALRVNQQNKNALDIAEFLANHEAIDSVYYPGLEDHPDHKIAKDQMHGFGGMLSFEVNDDPNDFVKRLKIIKPAISLGGVETTISSPELTSHSKLTAEEREKAGIKSNLLRLSVGIESVSNLIDDLKQALGNIG